MPILEVMSGSELAAALVPHGYAGNDSNSKPARIGLGTVR